jgi:hypothetical protein
VQTNEGGIEMRRTATIVALALAATAVLAGGGSGGGYDPVNGSFAGKVRGTTALIGLVTNGRQVLAYASDGKTISRWFAARAHGGALDVRRGGYRLQMSLSASGGSGTLTLEDGTSHPFRLRTARGKAGLWRGERTLKGVRYIGGWIATRDRTQRGAVTTQRGLRAFDDAPTPVSEIYLESARVRPLVLSMHIHTASAPGDLEVELRRLTTPTPNGTAAEGTGAAV